MTGSTLDQHKQSQLLKLGRSLLSSLELESVLNSVLKMARELTGSKYAALAVISKDGKILERFITSGIDASTRNKIGDLPQGRGLLGLLLEDPHSIRLDDLTKHPASAGFPPHHPPMKTFLGVPILIQGHAYGNLYIAEKFSGSFTTEDQEAIETLASWAAIAIDNARSVVRERLQQSIRSSEQERARWARELHDETLQGLAALKVLLSAALTTKSHNQLQKAAVQATDQIDLEIQNLRSLISDLRPAALDELGLIPALEDLVVRTTDRVGLSINLTISTRARQWIEQLGGTETECTIYRLIQESLTNVTKHAKADTATVEINALESHCLEIKVSDDGIGFDQNSNHAGVGITGMYERVELTQGDLTITSTPTKGTTVTATIKVEPPT